MKNKLIAVLIATTLMGGAGVTAYAQVNPSTVKQTANASMDNIDLNCEEGTVSNSLTSENERCENNSQQPTIKKVGVFKYVWCNVKNSFNNFCDFIQGIINGNKPGNGSNDNAGNNNGDINDNIQVGEENKPEDNNGSIEQPDNGDNNGGQAEQPNNGTGNNKPDVEVPPTNNNNNKPSNDNIVTPPASNIEKPNVNDKFMAQVEQAIFQKVNQERAKAGMSALSYNTTMEKYARIKSKDMGDNNYFSHEDLNGNLITTQMKKDGVTYRAWGENIAYIGGVSDPTALANQFMTNWMNSSGHRANILSGNFSSIGIGVYKIGNKVYATQEFYR